MPLPCNQPPQTDPSPIFELFRGSYATELLVAAVAHFDLFGKLGDDRLSFDAFRLRLNLEPRPANVLLTAIRAMGLIIARRRRPPLPLPARQRTPDPRRSLLRRRLSRSSRQNPRRHGDGRAPPHQPPRREQTRRHRGGVHLPRRHRVGDGSRRQCPQHHPRPRRPRENVAPVLAQKLPLDGAKKLLDVGGGTGIYSSPCSSNTRPCGPPSSTAPRCSRSPKRWPKPTASPTAWN